MGACASAPSGAAAYGEPVVAPVRNIWSPSNAGSQATALQGPVSRRYGLQTADTALPSSTADKIATAIINQTAADRSNRGLIANIASRRNLPDTSARGPAPAAESTAGLQPSADGAAVASLDRDVARPPEPSDDSFERAREATSRHLLSMQRSHRSSTAAATAWPAPRPSTTGGAGGQRFVEKDEYGFDSDEHGSECGSSGIGGSSRRRSQQGVEAAEEVTPVGHDVGASRYSVDEPEAATPWRAGGEEDRALSRISSASGSLAGNRHEDPSNPPLPGSLLTEVADHTEDSSWAGGRPRTGPRYSEISYLQQQSQQPPLRQASNVGGAAARLVPKTTRSSDLGFYLEEARLTTAAHGATPIRHNMLDTPLARQLEAREPGVPAPKAANLDYVPKLRKQPSRGNALLTQPSQRQRHLGGVLEAPGDGDDTAATAQAQRLEYVPGNGASRRWNVAPSRGVSAVSLAQQPSPVSVSRAPTSSLPTPTDTFSGSGGGGGADVSGSRRYINGIRFGIAAGAAPVSSGTPPAAPSPLGFKPAFDPRVAGGSAFISHDNPGNSYDEASVHSTPLAARRQQPASVDVLQLRGGGGPFLPASPAQLEHRPSAPLLGGTISAAPTASQQRESLRSVAWTDLNPQATVARARVTAASGGAASTGDLGTGPSNGGDGGRGLADRTSRLMASLHRLGVVAPEVLASPVVKHGTSPGMV